MRSHLTLEIKGQAPIPLDVQLLPELNGKLNDGYYLKSTGKVFLSDARYQEYLSLKKHYDLLLFFEGLAIVELNLLRFTSEYIIRIILNKHPMQGLKRISDEASDLRYLLIPHAIPAGLTRMIIGSTIGFKKEGHSIVH